MSAEEYNSALEALNELLDSWRDEDIDLGLYDVRAETEIPKEYVRHLRYNLAMELAMEHGLNIDPVMYAKAAELKGDLEDPVIPEMEIDEALLVGNRRWDIYRGSF